MNTNTNTNTKFNLPFLCLLIFLLIALQAEGKDKTPHNVDDVLTKEQQAILSDMESKYRSYTLSECEEEIDLYKSYTKARSQFSVSMAAPPTVEEVCCDPGASENDAEELISSGIFSNSESGLGLGFAGVSGSSGASLVGLRFDCYDIPQGAKIISADIQFTANVSSSRGAAFTIKGEDADNCAPFTAATPISGRVATSANVPWSPPTWVNPGDALPAQKTPDLSSIVQEIINRPGYAAGNALCFSISGKGFRSALSFDAGQGAPELCIEYEIPEEITTCEECPNVTMASLDGVPGFATVDLLNVCSSPDTISLLIYNNGECDLSNVQLTLNLDAGLTYGGCVMEHYGGPVPTTELDVSNPTQPVFLITQIDSAEAYILDICVKADCDVDIKSEDPLNFDANLVYSYPDDSGVDEICDVNLTEIGEFNGGVRIPVLNTLSIVPQEIAIKNTTDDFCQTITISQDGIQASLSQYTLDICGLDLTAYTLGTISANGTPINPADITVDPATGIATMNINGSLFNGNTGAGANGDDIFDVDERMTLSVCYSASGCTDEAMVPEYKVYYGCADKVCFGVTSILGAVKFTPNFGASPVANTSDIQYGSICGDDLSYTIDLFSANTDPLDGLWQDLILKYGACLGNGMTISDIVVGGTSLDPSIWTADGSTLILDFTNNTNPAYGLTDEDGDGFMDDLPGGQTLTITTSVSIGCSDSMAGCNGDLACSLSRIEVNGKRNCGQDFQQFANLSEPLSFFYGNAGSTTNDVPTPGYGIPITEIIETTCDVWTPSVNGYEFSYDFDSENIGHCAMSGGIKLVATITAGGNRINHIRFENGSATYQGAAVPGAIGYPNTIDLGGGLLDTVSYTVEVPAGDANATSHDYYLNLEFEGKCFPWDYMFINYKVVEECNSCTDVDPCEIVRACDSSTSYVRWRGCGCVCDIMASIDTIQRCNFGYADKAMTQKLTAADVPVEDLTRFLPGDTMYVRIAYEVLNAQVYYEGNYAWLFDLRYRGWDNPLMPDIYNAAFQGWFHEDISAGTGPIEIGIPDCMQAYDDANRDNNTFPGLEFQNFGVEGTLADGGECVDDDINPNYPAEDVNYRMVGLSAWDDVEDLSRMWVYFGRDEGCASATPDEVNNTCHADLLAQLDLEDGDFFYIDMKIPMVRNPNASLAVLNGITPAAQGYLYPYADARMASPGTCSSSVTSRGCRSTGVYEGHLPGPVSIAQEVCVTDCDTEVEYTFTLQNQLPDVDPGITPWYENEFRPFMATEYLELSFPSNMVYLDNGVIVMPDGTEVSFSQYIDTNSGNINCLTGPSGEQCCIAADPSQLGMMKVIDDDYTIGQGQTYYRGPIGANNTNDHCDVQQLIHVRNNPFPHLPVGGGENCTYGIKYSLSALCPEDIESGDFQLSYQFADPYVPSLPGSGGPYNSTYLSRGNIYPSSNGFRYPDNPYGTGCNVNPEPWGCQRHFEGIVSNPDDSPGSINPMRQTGTIVTGPDNFKDNSKNFPPLIATMQNTLIADEAMVNEMNTYTVCADNNGVDEGTHENVVTTIQIPTTIDLIDICDAAGVPVTWNLVEARPNDNLYSVVNPDLAPGECFEIIIKTELLFCPVGLEDVDVEICVTTVSGCIEPDKAALFTALGETQCDAAGACYEYIAEEAEMQAEWSGDATGEYPLCETFEMAVRIKNVRPTILTDIEPEWYFPAGMTFVPNSWKVCFPGGPGNYGTVMSIADPIADPTKNNIYGTYFEFLDDADFSTYIDQNGLPGVAAMLDSNKVEFKFDVQTDCDEFVSGTSIWFRADGADPCEMRTGSGFVPTSPIIIDGANPSDFAQFFVFADPLDATCGEPSTITMNFLNISPTGVTDNSMVCMDIDSETFSYMSGSISWLTPAGHMPTFTEEVNGAITHVCFDIPDGIGPGSAFQVSFMFEVPEDIGCGEQDLGVNVSSTVMNTNCMAQGIECDVQVLNSVNPAIQVDFNPPVEVSDQVVTAGCGNGDGTVPICYEVDLANNSVDYNDDIKIKLIRDLNQNGILEDFDPPLDSAIVNVTVLMGDTTTIMGCFDIDENLACPVFLMVMQETNCVCDAQDFYYDSIEPSASDELGQSIAICPGSPLKIGYCGDLEYSISPAAGATMAPNAAGDSLCITLEPGFGLSSPVVLMVTSQTGGCAEFDFETEIYSLGNFEFNDYDAEEACDVGCIQLDLDLPTEYRDIVTVSWSPTTYLDDPTSQKPMVCNPAMDVTYTVTVNFMENGQMCEFEADYPVVVVPQETNDLFDQVSLCSEETSTVEGPAGFSNYNWFEVTPAGDIPVQSGTSPILVVPQPGTYYLEYYNVGDACKTLSSSFDALACPSLIKSFVSAIPTENANEYTVCYEIAIDNNSSLATEYDLYDLPTFDSDITIISASYTSSVGPSGVLAVPPPASPGWLLGNDVQLVGNGGHTYSVCAIVVIDLADGGENDNGDDEYTSCGSNGGGSPIEGEGLYNEASLDMNEDGEPDATDDACGELPHYTLEKELTDLTQTGAYTWTVTYEIDVCNDGGAIGTYDLDDVPGFDDDIVINGASFTTDAFDHPSNPGPTTLTGSGPWDLADGQDIEPDECQKYTVVIMVTMDLEDEDTPGDGDYDACGENGGTDPVAGEGLFNSAELDTNGDGEPNLEAEDCGDLPSITHDKELTSITQVGGREWEVKYTITVENNGGATGSYGLDDEIAFEDDITVTCVKYNSDAPGNTNNPGPTDDTDLAGPWNLATGQDIVAEGVHTYCITFCVTMDLNSDNTPGDGDYDECGAGGGEVGEPGEGLFNQSHLDLDGDGEPEETEEACGDLPNLYHEKTVVSFAPMANGNHMITYEICVYNNGGADGTYDLYDEPQFDDDIEIIAGTYSCDIGGAGSTLTPPVPAGGWLLIDDQDISPGNEHCCTVEFEVDIDVAPGSGGDNVVTECGTETPGDPSPGEALYNESSLDLNNDGEPDEQDEACEDVFDISHDKTIADLEQTGHNTWCITYNITVTNNGNESGFYDLYDWPQYDQDITITSAEYSSSVHPLSTLTPTTPTDTTDWQLGNDVSIGSDVAHVYVLKVCVEIDLEDGGAADAGDDVYQGCGDGGSGMNGIPGQGLYNESYLDTNDDGTIDETDEVCEDIPYITLNKEVVGTVQTGARDFTVSYEITVCNIGGADGEYAVSDQPCFDDDIVINGASYGSDVAGHSANPGPSSLTGTGPWTLNTAQTIAADGCDTYTLDVEVTMDLNDPATPGDGVYSGCASGDPADPSSTGGLYNKSMVDTDGDGEPDLQDEACEELPYVTHEKSLTSITQTGATSWEVKYTIEVTNTGGAAGQYDLSDEIAFEDDIVVTCVNYMSDAPGNANNPGPTVDTDLAGPWGLADDQSIAVDGLHTYMITFCVDMDLNDPAGLVGDGDYTACGAASGTDDSEPGEGLHNESSLDVNNDGVEDEEDEACGDLPHIYHEKIATGFEAMANGNHMVSYQICVYNDGGATGEYDLYDEPIFDDDIEIIESKYTCGTDPESTLSLPVPAGGWLLLDDQSIDADGEQCCTIDIEVHIDTAPGSGGDDVVTECGTAVPGDPSPGEALYNESTLDLNNDGEPDEMDEACEDVFMFTHDKSIIDLEQTGHNEWCITYKIVVNNDGNEPGFYDLYDWPQYDADITILSAEYSSTVHPTTILAPTTPTSATDWKLANDENVAAQDSHVYILEVCVSIDLEDGGVADSGDDVYQGCGDGAAGMNGMPGQGLYNESYLDTNDDGTIDETDEVCADIPYITLNKDVVGTVQTGARDFTVSYEITVCNIGGADGEYTVSDQPCFDDDIVINGASYGSNVTGHSANPGPSALTGTGPWTLNSGQVIPGDETCHTYLLDVEVTMDLNDPATPGDGVYSGCASGDPADPSSTGGLYNKSMVDTDGDGEPDIQDEACEELPYVTHEKDLTSITQTGATSWEVKYTIEVNNTGGAAGQYDLSDEIAFEDDIVVTCVNYMSDAPGNANNPGPTVDTDLAGPWDLADDQAIATAGVHTYMITFCVDMDLNDPAGLAGDGEYTACGAANGGDDSEPGEGLHNESSLDVNNDGVDDEEDEACGDLPHIYHEKIATGFVAMANGNHMVSYQICVYNDGGATGEYDLYDEPIFDDDIEIIEGKYTCGTDPESTLTLLVPAGGWLLLDDQSIDADGEQCCTIDIEVHIDTAPGSGGDNVIADCGTAIPGDPSPGEALYNESTLDLNNDGEPDEMDEACEDVFMFTHDKSIIGLEQTGHNEWCITYQIVVNNDGNEPGFYDLYDWPQYDQDITILSAEYSSTVHPTTILTPTTPTDTTDWQLANDENVAAQDSHVYVLEVCVSIDLADGGAADAGDDVYQGCGDGAAGMNGMPGQGLYNESYLDTNDDGNIDETDEVCADLPFITLNKDVTGTLQTGARDFTVSYEITVCNIGGAEGEYAVSDQPCFDDDIVINGASYSSDVAGHSANPGPSTLAGTGPWTLNSAQTIAGDGTCHTYTLDVEVTMDLNDPTTPGDGVYSGCASGDPADPSSAGGLYNKSMVDTDGDGEPDLQDEACEELPHVTHTKDLTSITQTGATSWEVKYTIEVSNTGGAAGEYDLSDEIAFEDDIEVTCVNYMSDAPGNSNNPGPTVDTDLAGPWDLADDQAIAASGVHTYMITFCVDMDLNDPAGLAGDGDYTACGAANGGDDSAPGEGLHNESSLDVNNDGVDDEEDEACGDLPHIYHEKVATGFVPMANGNHMVSYQICVYNDGGADGDYDLYDEPIFDDDIEVIEATYSCDTDPGSTLTAPVPAGGWLLLDDQTIPAGGEQCCTIDIEVHIDVAPGSGGDNVVTDCGTATGGGDPSPGEALYNESTLDLNNDGEPDEMDEACEDVYMITHEKSIADLEQTDHNEWCITYNINVVNDGNEPGFYDLYDWPQYDADITIISAKYSSAVHPTTNLMPTTPTDTTDWQLANDVSLGANSNHIYTIEICVEINLEDGGAADNGDDFYTACGDGGDTDGGDGLEGLYNESFLDTNDDGTVDETDEVCADLPYFTLDKDTVSLTDTGAYIWDMVYTVEVCNIGGAADDYDLVDQPCFEDDIEIQYASFVTDAPGHPANGVPTQLFGTGPWELAEDQNTEPDSCHIYTLTVGVFMNLNDPNNVIGDAEYESCEDVNPANPFATGGLYNKTALDANDDGEPDIFDAACDDLPLCEELQGTVFYDLNNNGCQDNGETAVTEDISVTLFECGEGGAPDVEIASTTTIDGEYNFSTGSPNENADVCPSPDKEYYVVFDIPNGPDEELEHWNFSSHETTCANPEDGDNINGDTGRSDCFDPEDDDGDDGDDDEHIDAGIYPCQDLAGGIFYDIDNDGCQEAGEDNVVEDVTVNLYECGADGTAQGDPVATGTTVGGEYEFGPESDTPGGEICLDPSKTYIVEFVLDNGVGEPLGGWEFTSHDDEVCGDIADTDDIDPGTGQSECYDPNDDDGQDGDDSNDDNDGDIDGGIYPCQDITGEIFWDINNNGCQDNGETLVTEDVMVELFECDATGEPTGPSVANTTVDDGMYDFSWDSEDEGAVVCLDPTKTYFVQFSFNAEVGDPLEGQDFSTNEDVCANPEDSDDIDPSTGNSGCYDPNDDDDDDGDDDNDVDAGINPCEEIRGEVFVDLNNNGCQDDNEVLSTDPINVSVYECGSDPDVDPPFASTQTVDGMYEFGPNSPNDGADVCLDPVKDYFIKFDIPKAPGDPLEFYEFSSHDTETCSSGDASDDIDPSNGQSDCLDPEDDDDDDGDDDEHVDVGIYPCQDVAGEIFYDIDNDGCQETGDDNVVEDVTVNLYECGVDGTAQGAPIATGTTVGGEYEFGPDSDTPGGVVCLDPSKQYIVEFVIDNGVGEPLGGWAFTSHDNEVCADSADSDDVDPGTGQSECYDPNEDDGHDGDDTNDDDDSDIDSGIYPCQDITGEIFWDINNNGCQDNMEMLVTEDVMVELFECDENGNPTGPSAASTTVNDGMYDFSWDSEDEGAVICLDPTKEYYVQFSFNAEVGDPLEGQDFSTGEETCADSSDADDIDPATGSSDCYDPNDDDDDDGDDDNNVDAGINPCEEIRGEVFVDLNNNGCQDDDEVLSTDPINVSVYECGSDPDVDPPFASTQTIDGMYEFGPNSPNDGADVCLDPVKDYFIKFEIPKEPGDPLEYYEFSSHDSETCSSGDATDDIDPSNGQSECLDPEDDDDDDGDDDEHVDVGIYPCQDLSGEIFLDVNNNGCEDIGEGLVLEDVMVELFECDASGNPSGPSISSITTNDGEYEFGPASTDEGGNVCLDPSKTYYVQFSFDDSEGAPLQGHNFSSDGNCADELDADDIDPDTGESGCFNPNDDDDDDGDDDNHVDAGINPCQEISGEVFFDIAGDGCEDGDDTAVMDEVTVKLYECSDNPGLAGTLLATTTTINGEYMFGEESPNPGAQVCLQSDKQYYVDFDIANGPGEAFDNYVFTNGSGANCAQTADSDDVDDFTGTSNCQHPDDSDGDEDDHIDAGLMELACIGNFVWHDLDGNGIQDPGEPGLENVVVRLYDSNGTIVSVTSTDSNGYYVFDYLYPGDYYLEFAPLSQYPLSTDPNRGGDTELDSDIDNSNGPNTTNYTTLIPGECDHSWDAGFYNCVPIGELVWYDVDMDNVWDDNENGINGLDVTLYKKVNGNWKKYAEEVTGHKPGTPSDDGYYKFCAPPGEYYLHIDLPPYGLVPVRSDIGTDELRDSDFDHGNGPNTTSSFTVRCDEERCDIGAGFYPMATVGDIVWMDDNADGVRQPTEAFAQGVVVEAYDIYNDMVGSDVTDANGSYMIDYLQQEGYYLRIQPPSGYTVTSPNVGGDESMDSDIDHSNGNYTTQYYQMDPGIHMPNVDAGLVAGVALPVELLSFTGQYRPDYVYLSWATAAEINTEYFQIERRHESDDEFVSIGRQLTKGSDSKYNMNDYDVAKDGLYYYRLRSIDTDGSEQLSEVISVEINRNREDGVSIYPNPAVSDVNIELSLSSPKQVKIDIYDTQGKLMRGNAFSGRLDAGVMNTVIDVKDIPAGVYNLQIQLGDELFTRRLILLKN